MSCSICCEPFNKTSRAKVKCCSCTYDMCRNCNIQYLLNTTELPHCMNCKFQWTRNVMHSNFSATFLNQQYKKHREKILYEKQLALMPDTQYYVEIQMRENKYKAEIKNLESRLSELNIKQTEYRNTLYEFYHEDFDILLHNCKKEIVCTKLDIDFKNQLIQRNRGLEKTTIARRNYVRACPSTDCKGFLDSDWKCGLCNISVCKKCHEEKNEEHVCNENSLKTAALLMKDSKPCPKCSAMIFKIEGCDQMFCVVCNTAFSWKNGTIETGRIHNPHYYEYQRRIHNGNIPREQGDEVCGGLPHYYQFYKHISQIIGICKEEKQLSNIHRLYSHIEYIVLPTYNININTDFRKLRVKYMMKEISEDEFKIKLQRFDKAAEKKNDIRLVLQTFLNVTLDALIKIQNAKTKTEILDCFDNLIELREYINECMVSISIMYKNVAPYINEKWEATTYTAK